MSIVRTVLAALFLAACSGAPELEAETHDVSQSPSAQERADAALARAQATWTEAVGWVPSVDRIRFDEPDSDDDRTAAMWDEETRTLILVPVRIGDDPERWAAVVAHELGHAYGLGHVGHVGALMSEQASATACVQSVDAAALSDLLGVDVRATCR